MAVDLFNGREHWRRLSVHQQAEIGALALELVVAWHAMERCDEDNDHLPDAVLSVMEPDGDAPLIDALREAFVDAIPAEAVEAPNGNPRVPSELWHRAQSGRAA